MNARPILAALALCACQNGDSRSTPHGKVVAPATGHRLVATDLSPVDKARAPQKIAAPWSLTASDGSGLQLTRVDAKAVVQGPLAFTELHLYFHNPEDRTREGTFAITLPSGAAVSRFAMEIDGKMQEAEVVEKAVARRVYDDFLHRRQDPALLEKAAGNQFNAKVFPIPAKSAKHLVLSFSQELAGRSYTLPLRGLPKTDRIDVELATTHLDGSLKPEKLSETNWQPDRDFVASTPASAAAVSSGALVVGTFAFTPATNRPTVAPQELTLLVDTSASRALGFAGYVDSIRTLIDALQTRYGDELTLQVIAFDQDSQPIFDGVAAGYGDAHHKALLARGAAGASNLAQVVATLAASRKPPHRRLVIVTDGVMTAGPETPVLVAAIKQLPIDRVDVVLAGGIRDERLAASVARAGLPQAGDVFDLDRGIETVAAGLAEPVSVDVAIDVPGATWVYPKHVPAARPGSPLMVYARMPKAVQTIEIVLDGKPHTLGLGSATPALIERAVAGAEIEEIENTLAATTDTTVAQTLREDIAKRSVRARVISSQTSMLVLETEADYARYKIERTTLADILVIGPNGLEQTRRATILAAKTPAQKSERDSSAMAIRDPALAREMAIELARNGGVLGTLTGTSDVSSGFNDTNIYGGLLGNEVGEAQGGFGFGRSGFGPGGGGTGSGTIGTGRYGTIGRGTGSGYGVGGGRGGMRGRTSAVPSVSIGQPNVVGDLDKTIIRRYIKRNIQRITFCYEKELLTKPTIAGTVTVQFLIANGKVTTATASGVDATVASCVGSVIKAIEFPAGNGGNVQVSYPLTFRRDGGGDTWAAPLPQRNAAPPQRNAFDLAPPAGDSADKRAPLTGKLADVMKALKGGSVDQGLGIAKQWHDESPGDVLALIALGEALEAKHDLAQAARIYGSVIDLFSTRADLRRFAGERLERLGKPSRALVIDTYRKAVADRPDHATGHRLLAYALVRNADYAEAFTAILAGVDQPYPDGRFRGADRVLGDDAGMIAAVYLANGGKRDVVMKELEQRKLVVADQPSTRFIMYWETDANDVDFHIHDSRGGHAWYSNKKLPSGGELYADVTTGYGPECFAIMGKPTAAPYRLTINYFSQGPMGYGMGLLQIQRFDGKSLTFEDRPYVIMIDHAFVDLGTVP